jgi:hypothetical protein
MKAKKADKRWHWCCNAEDNWHGRFDPDWEGRCEAKSNARGYATEANARRELEKHLGKCWLYEQFHQAPTVYCG